MPKRTIVGVDYGTTTTQISYLTDAGIPDLVRIGHGEGYEKYMVRSVVGLDVSPELKVVVGDEARERKGRVVLPSLKRCLMCSYDKSTGQGNCTNPPNQSLCSGLRQYDIGGRTYTAEELIEHFFQAVMQSWEPGNGQRIIDIPKSDVRLSVPPMFERNTIDRLSKAIGNGLHANLSDNPKDEPVSALATLFNQGLLQNGLHVVCDIGGGTTDVTMLEKTGEQAFLLEPRSLMVGGNDLDQCLFNHLRPRLTSDEHSDAALMRECRLAKERLSRSGLTRVRQIEITLNEFETLIGERVAEIVAFVKTYIRRNLDLLGANVSRRITTINVHLVGGASRVPLIQSGLSALQFEGVQVRMRPVRGTGEGDVYGEDFPLFCIALGNVLDLDNFNLFSLPVTIFVRKGRTVIEEIPSRSPFPVAFPVDWSAGVTISAEQGQRSFDLMRSRQCKPPISAVGQYLQKNPEPLAELLRRGRCRFRFVHGGYFNVEVQGMRRWFEAPWKSTLDETKHRLTLTTLRKEIGLGTRPRA